MLVCPYDMNHRMPKSSMEKHVATCKLRKLGYSKEEADVCNTSFFHGKSLASTFSVDKALQFQIIKQAREKSQIGNYGNTFPGAYSLLPPEVPQNHKHTICDLTQADRLAIYDYVLEETKKQQSRAQSSANDSDLFEDLTAKMNRDGDQKTPKSHLEVLAEMRDYKRRRQSYRAKNVHITKKSYTEVIRDVISVHMEELCHHWQEEDGSEDSETMEAEGSSNSLKSIVRIEEKHSESVHSLRSGSVESMQSSGVRRNDNYSWHSRDHSSSPQKWRSRDEEKVSRNRKGRMNDRRSESLESTRSDSVESVQSSGLHREDDNSRHRREHSGSPHKLRSRGEGKECRKSKGRVEGRRSESVDSVRSGSVESVQSSELYRDDDDSRRTRDHSSSPRKQRRRGEGKKSRKRKGMDEEKHHGHKKRK